MNLKTWIPALLMAAGASQALSPVETYGALSVKGNKVVDSKGSAATLRGMSLFWHYHMGGAEFWTSGVLKWAMTDWHASVIRAPIGVDNASSGTSSQQGYISDPTSANTAIHRVIEAAIDAGLYIIVDWHTEKIHTAEAKVFFGALAKEYGNTPNIIWEIYNEPNNVGWSDIASYSDAVIAEIRKYSENLVLVGNPEFDQHPDAAGTELDKYSNIAYTVHFYNGHSHQGTVANAMGAAHNHAVFASEWGMSGYSGDGGFGSIQSGPGTIPDWIKTLDAAGVSSCNWSLGNPKANSGVGPASETSAALMQGASYSGKWDPAVDLTASGKSIRDYLRSKNPAWTLPDTTTKLSSALKINSAKTTDFVLKTDTISLTAGYNKSVSWTVTETGRTSKGVVTTTGTGSNVAVRHAVSKKNLGAASFVGGETVDVKLAPLGSPITYTISTITGVQHRVHETAISWAGTRLSLPGNLIAQGAPVRVMLRDAAGQVIWQASATMGANGQVELSQPRPRSVGLQILDVTSEGAYVRSQLAPSF